MKIWEKVFVEKGLCARESERKSSQIKSTEIRKLCLAEIFIDLGFTFQCSKCVLTKQQSSTKIRERN